MQLSNIINVCTVFMLHTYLMNYVTENSEGQETNETVNIQVNSIEGT